MAFSDEQIQIGALPGFMEILPRSPEDQRQKHFLPPGCIQQWIIWIIKLSFPFFSYSSASEAGPKRFCVALCKVAYFPTFLYFYHFWLSHTSDFYSYIFFILNNIVFCILKIFTNFEFYILSHYFLSSTFELWKDCLPPKQQLQIVGVTLPNLGNTSRKNVFFRTLPELPLPLPPPHPQFR